MAKEGRERVLVGVAWPYANGHLHLGHIAGCYLPPDIFARYHRMAGNEVLMVSGSDEHGTPITVRAEEEGVEPKEITDRYHAEFLETFADLGIAWAAPDAFDETGIGFFTRTGTDNHREVVHDVFRTLEQGGYIEERDQEALYCETDERYLPDRYVEGTCPHCGYEEARGDQCDDCGKTLDAPELVEPRCKICGDPPVVRETTHLFFKLSAFQERLLDWVETTKKDVFRDNVYDFTKNWLTEGLKDRPITRDIHWGVPVPAEDPSDGWPREGYEDKRIYVWFEAVIGYYSATVEWARRMAGKQWDGRTVGEDDWERFWLDPECRVYNFLAKDNIPFHTIIWPAMLMGYWEGKRAAGEVADGEGNLPHDVPANEYLTWTGEKFSTSRGVGWEVPAFLERYPADALRYHLTRNMPENRDADFDPREFVDANNNELVATLGNLVHRTLTFTARHFDAVPAPAGPTDDDRALLDATGKARDAVGSSLDACRFKEALGHLMELARHGNRYFDRTAPWDLAKEEDARDRLATVLHTALSLSRALTVLMAPFTPFAAERAWRMLGQEGSVHDAGTWALAGEPIEPGTPLGDPEPLFEKLEPPEAGGEGTDEGTAPADGADDQAKPTEETKPMVSFDDFKKIDLRTGRIVEVKDHPNADKLYVLKVDLGGEERQLVAGLRPYLDKDELEDQPCVVVANMEPAELRGETSEGMLLAAEQDGKVSLIQPGEGVGPGAKVL